MYKPKILIVEDDLAIRNLLKTTLQIYDYSFDMAENGKEAISKYINYNPDIVILDLGLPDMDGLEIIEIIRGFSFKPIIILSARNQDKDKVKALDLGADDYLTKPFSIEEFLARLRALIRRSNATSSIEDLNVYENGDLKIDYDSGVAYICNEQIHLTPIEYKLLVLLSRNTGKVLTHNYIIKEVWGQSYSSDTQSLRVFMATLRKKLEVDRESKKYIQTHVGVGYRMIKY